MKTRHRTLVLCMFSLLFYSCFRPYYNYVHVSNPHSGSPGKWFTIHYPGGIGTPPVKDSVFTAGKFVQVEEGLKVYASAYRLGGWLIQSDLQDFSGKVVYMKWKADTGHDFADIHAVLYPSMDVRPGSYRSFISLSYLSTRNQWDESVLIPFSQEWFYTRIVFEKDRFISYTAKDNYDDRAGIVLQKFSKPLVSATGYIGMSFNDVYAGTAAWFVLGELMITRK